MKTITTTREYDEKGNLVKEVVVEMDDGSQTWIAPYVPTPYWQSPTITWTCTTSDNQTTGIKV